MAYGSDLKQVKALIEDAVNGLHHPLLDPDRPAKVVVVDLGDNSVNLKLITWVQVLKQAFAESDLKDCIYTTLNEHNIEIPFPQCDVHIRN